MWPDDFIEWSRRLYPHAYRIASQAMIWRNDDPHFQAEIPELARRARQTAFELARQHLPVAGYFADFHAFRFWIMAVVSQQTIRLYLLHPAAQARLNSLPLLERRLLGMVYVDHITDSEVATLLGITASQVRGQAIAGLGRV